MTSGLIGTLHNLMWQAGLECLRTVPKEWLRLLIAGHTEADGSKKIKILKKKIISFVLLCLYSGKESISRWSEVIISDWFSDWRLIILLIFEFFFFASNEPKVILN